MTPLKANNHSTVLIKRDYKISLFRVLFTLESFLKVGFGIALKLLVE